jgi:RND superfamily putative drug exporter
LTTEAENSVETDSSRADALLEEHLWGELPATETVIVDSGATRVDDPAYESFVRGLTADLRALQGDVAAVTNAYESPDLAPVSDDKLTTLVPVVLVGSEVDAADHAVPLLEVVERWNGRDGFAVYSIGAGSVSEAYTTQSEKDLQTAELIGIPVAIIVLLLVFGALVAAGLPLGLALLSITIAIGAATIVGRVFELSIFMVNFVTTMGLAVGIDYALLIVKRFREERQAGLGRDAAVVRTGDTAGRAVLFSGLTVIAALLGMVIVPNNIFRSLGFGAILVVAVAVAAALTLLPAVLRLLDRRVDLDVCRFRAVRRLPKAASGTRRRSS